MKKVAIIGFFVWFGIVAGIAMTLYPKRGGLDLENEVTSQAVSYAGNQLFKVMKKAKNKKDQQSALARAQKAAHKIQQAASYAESVAQEAKKQEAQQKQAEKDMGMKQSEKYFTAESAQNVQQIKALADHAQDIINGASEKNLVVTKKEALFDALEQEL